MANETIYGCVNRSTGIITFEQDDCNYSGCRIKTGVHAGQVEVTIDTTICPDDTYYGCPDKTTGQFEIVVPENCCDIGVTSDNDCCCFLDPTPTPWSAEIEYDTYDMAEHDGSTYWSNVGNNLNNEPPHASWTEYTACDNENWNSIPPFGGIAKTPYFYKIAIRVVIDIVRYYWDEFSCELGDLYVNLQATLDAVVQVYHRADIYAQSDCHWGVWAAATQMKGTWSYLLDPNTDCEGTFKWEDGNCGIGSHVSNGLHLRGSPRILLIFIFNINWWTDCVWTDQYEVPVGLPIDDCAMKGTTSMENNQIIYPSNPPCNETPVGHNNIRYDASWKPLDCNYTVWDSTTTYSAGDCVVWKGKFLTCKLGHINQEPPNVTYWTDVS